MIQLDPIRVHSRSFAAIPKPQNPLGLYVHIPFCHRKCHYCDFAAGPAPQQIRDQYVDVLVEEIRGSPWRGEAARTIYFGGGTPSELSTDQLARVLEALRGTFAFQDHPSAAPGRCSRPIGPIRPIRRGPGTTKPPNDQTTRRPDDQTTHPSPLTPETSIECNPRTVSEESLAAMVEMGFNRVSLGVQSFHDHQLKALGRIHNAAEAGEIVFAARRAGFRRVNLDLIFCLPGQTMLEWQSDVERALELGPDHLSLYNLTIEEKSEFGRRHRLGMLALPDEDLSADMYEWVIDRAARAGLEQYEVSNFALPGQECRHNRIYWRQEEYLGFGLGAASYVGGCRWSATRSMQRYLSTAASDSGAERALEERLAPEEACGEGIMLGLRTRDGVDLAAMAVRHSVDASRYAPVVERLVREGLLTESTGTMRLTRRGIMLANAVCGEFL